MSTPATTAAQQSLMRLPECEQHGQMEFAPSGSPEQAFCGTWYRCSRCASSVLFSSLGLTAQLAQQAAA